MPEQSHERPPSSPDLSDESDAGLLAVLEMWDDESLSIDGEAFVEEAFVELHERYAGQLLSVLPGSGEARAYEAVKDEEGLVDLVNDTFIRARRYADSYDPERGSVREWLFSIAKNLAIDALNKEETSATNLDRVDVDGDDLERVAAQSDFALELGDAADPDPERIALIEEAIKEALTDWQRELLLPYLAVKAQGDSSDRADKGAAQGLAEELDTTTQNLRTNRTRCINRIGEYLRERVPGEIPE